MAVTAVKAVKQGARRLLQVDLEGAEGPAYPPLCPCCNDPAERGVFLPVQCGPAEKAERPPGFLRFPTCRVCARHVPFFARLTDFMGWLILALTLVTVGFGLIGFAAYSSGQSGWEVVYVGLRLPFRGPILGMLTLLIAGAVGVGYAVLSGVIIVMPLYWILAKRGCEEVPVKAEIVTASPRVLRLTFENVRYGAAFVKTNGGEMPAAPPPGAVRRPAPASRGASRRGPGGRG
jgi:hypothetical protein